MNTISRDQQRRCVTVTATVADGYNVTHVTSAARQALGSVALPDGVTVEFNGENEQIMDAMGQLLLMLLLGVVLVYFIMVAQFQSLKSPFIVMFTIPLAFTGGFLALLIAGIEVSVISLIGFVMLVGIIVNNGIVLVDAYDEEVVDEAKNDVRVVLHLHPALAPYKAAILPLSKKLSEPARKIYEDLSKEWMLDFDETGSIGKRYRREDEVGTPFCITVDFDTVGDAEHAGDNCVTVRERDTMEQVRIPISELKAYLAEKLAY